MDVYSFCPDFSYYSRVKHLFNFSIIVNALGCFKCTSTNNDNAVCEPEDPVVNTNRIYYGSDCCVPRDRGGFFPSTPCIKVEVNDGKVLKDKFTLSTHLTAYCKVCYFGDFKISDSEETTKLTLTFVFLGN